ncbi:MAG: hypothetical protein KJ880_06660, partial [Candidatus Omnitrophica bacterium]|nr:hypothetical protein [Candidatus Omnitrophota bacterium]
LKKGGGRITQKDLDKIAKKFNQDLDAPQAVEELAQPASVTSGEEGANDIGKVIEHFDPAELPNLSDSKFGFRSGKYRITQEGNLVIGDVDIELNTKATVLDADQEWFSRNNLTGNAVVVRYRGKNFIILKDYRDDDIFRHELMAIMGMEGIGIDTKGALEHPLVHAMGDGKNTSAEHEAEKEFKNIAKEYRAELAALREYCERGDYRDSEFVVIKTIEKLMGIINKGAPQLIAPLQDSLNNIGALQFLSSLQDKANLISGIDDAELALVELEKLASAGRLLELDNARLPDSKFDASLVFEGGKKEAAPKGENDGVVIAQRAQEMNAASDSGFEGGFATPERSAFEAVWQKGQSEPVVISDEQRAVLEGRDHPVDSKLRILCALGSFGHGTSDAVDLSSEGIAHFNIDIQSLQEMLSEDDIFVSLRAELGNIHENMIVNGMSVITRLRRQAKRERDNPGSFSEQEVLSWERRFSDALESFRAARQKLENRLAELRSLSVGNDALLGVLSRVERGASSIETILSDRYMLMQGKVADEDVDLRAILEHDFFFGQLARTRVDPDLRLRDRFRIQLPDQQVVVRGNRRSLISLVCNLADNAYKYAQARNGENARVDIELIVNQEGRVIFRVSDNGEGITADRLKEIQRPFFTTGGTGIGLTESRMMLKDHRGSLEIESKVGEGSTLTVRLPTASSVRGLDFKAPEARLVLREEIEEIPDAKGHNVVRLGGRVLIVRDYWKSRSDLEQLNILMHEAMADWMERKGVDAEDNAMWVEGLEKNQEGIANLQDQERQKAHHGLKVDGSMEGAGDRDPAASTVVTQKDTFSGRNQDVAEVLTSPHTKEFLGLELDGKDIVLDIGVGAMPFTTIEQANALKKDHPNMTVIGTEMPSALGKAYISSKRTLEDFRGRIASVLREDFRIQISIEDITDLRLVIDNNNRPIEALVVFRGKNGVDSYKTLAVASFVHYETASGRVVDERYRQTGLFNDIVDFIGRERIARAVNAERNGISIDEGIDLDIRFNPVENALLEAGVRFEATGDPRTIAGIQRRVGVITLNNVNVHWSQQDNELFMREVAPVVLREGGVLVIKTPLRDTVSKQGALSAIKIYRLTNGHLEEIVDENGQGGAWSAGGSLDITTGVFSALYDRREQEAEAKLKCRVSDLARADREKLDALMNNIAINDADFSLELDKLVSVDQAKISAQQPSTLKKIIAEDVSNPGGIDLRALPIVTQPGTVPAANLSGALRGLSLKPEVALSPELKEIQAMIDAGITPSAERIREYLLSCCSKDSFAQEANNVLSCISDILRLEEEKCCATDSSIKEFLVLLESDKPAEELKLALANIDIAPKEPELVMQ